MPVTMPLVKSMLATIISEELQAPPVTASDKPIEAPMHTCDGPVILAGDPATTKALAVTQPVGRV